MCYNVSEFKALYQISEYEFLKYNSLIHNIPKTWKAQLASEGFINICITASQNK